MYFRAHRPFGLNYRYKPFNTNAFSHLQMQLFQHFSNRFCTEVLPNGDCVSIYTFLALEVEEGEKGECGLSNMDKSSKEAGRKSCS